MLGIVYSFADQHKTSRETQVKVAVGLCRDYVRNSKHAQTNETQPLFFLFQTESASF